MEFSLLAYAFGGVLPIGHRTFRLNENPCTLLAKSDHPRGAKFKIQTVEALGTAHLPLSTVVRSSLD